MKNTDPNCKFRLEVNFATPEFLATKKKTETGIEKPKSYFVELQAYKKEFGSPSKDSLVSEVINGIQVQGVNVQKGKAGWYKRIDRDVTDVSRTVQLTDGHVIDNTGEGLNRMEAAAKKAIIPEHKPAIHISDVSLGGSGPTSMGSFSRDQDAATAEPNAEGAGAKENASDEESEEVEVGFLGLLKKRFSSQAESNPKRPKLAHPKAAAAAPNRNASSSARQRESAPVQREADQKTPAPKPKVHKTSVGGAGLTSASRRKKQAFDADELGLADDGLSEIDKATLDTFFDRLKPLLSIAPPMAEAAWKGYLSSLVSNLNQLTIDVRLKRKSAKRRSSHDEFLAELDTLDNQAKAVHKLCRCSSALDSRVYMT